MNSKKENPTEDIQPKRITKVNQSILDFLIRMPIFDSLSTEEAPDNR